MVDTVSKATRSRIMSKIRGKNTQPEILLRKSLYKKGYSYALNHRFKELNFKPDMVMKDRKICIFVDGCFWHRCPRCFRKPKSNLLYWNKKIKDNVLRDKRQDRFLRQNGWRPIRIWEHEINQNLTKQLRLIIKEIKKKGPSPKAGDYSLSSVRHSGHKVTA